MHEGGSAAPRTPGKDGPDMETSAHHRSTRNTAALASPGVMAVYLELQSLYPHKLNYFTKTQLNYEKYDYFPSPLPDAYVRLQTKGDEKQFFLDIFEDTQPFFVLIRRIKKHLEYAESGDWAATDTGPPTILMVCETKSTHKRLRKRIAKELRESHENSTFATTTLQALLARSENKGKVWLRIDEDGDDAEELRRPRSLRTV
jgi:hypothetical protein